MDIGLLFARVVIGVLMAAHGSQKLFGWFNGYGLVGTGGFFEGLGYRPGRAFAAAAGVSEFVGGLLIAAGLLGPIGPAALIAVMIVAAVTVHLGKGLLSTSGGVEVPLLYGGLAAGLALTGFGRYSLDAALGLGALWTAQVNWAVIAIGVLAGFANLAVRKTAPAAHAAA